jgi:hypothetical protein
MKTNRFFLPSSAGEVQRMNKKEALAHVQPRQETGYIHLADIPIQYRGEFLKWAWHQTRPFLRDQPKEFCVYIHNWNTWKG